MHRDDHKRLSKSDSENQWTRNRSLRGQESKPYLTHSLRVRSSWRPRFSGVFPLSWAFFTGVPPGSHGEQQQKASFLFRQREETWVWSLGWEGSSGVGHGNPLQYAFLENPMDRGTWWTTVQGVEKELDTIEWLYNSNNTTSVTQLKDS